MLCEGNLECSGFHFERNRTIQDRHLILLFASLQGIYVSSASGAIRRLLLQAVRDGELVVFEEINMVLSEITSLLHPLLDWHRILPVPGVGQVKPHPSFRMLACINPGYAGTRKVNEALKSRFRSVKVPYPSETTVEEIIIRETGVKKEIAKDFSEIYGMIVKRVEKRDILEDAVNTRALIDAATEVVEIKLSPKEAITSNLCDPIEDPHTVSVVEEIIDSKIA